MATTTPWGAAQTSKTYGPGIREYTTASHGGFHLSQKRQDEMPEVLKNPSGWYEEDCEWCKVVIAFPGYFSDKEQVSAKETLKGWFYEAYEALYGIILKPGESYEKDKDLFYEQHKNDWVGISAIKNKHDDNLVDVTATLGGKRGRDVKERNFLVPVNEYQKRARFGFVITDQREVFEK